MPIIYDNDSESRVIASYKSAMSYDSKRRRIMLRWLLWRIDNAWDWPPGKRLKELDDIEKEFKKL